MGKLGTGGGFMAGPPPATNTSQKSTQVATLSNDERNAALRAKNGGDYGKRGSYGPVDSGGFTAVQEIGGGTTMGSWGGSGAGSGGGMTGGGFQMPSYPSFTSNTATNPQLDALSGEWAKYRGSLAAGNDQDAINAMQRQRDLASGALKEASGVMSARGRTPGSGAYNLTASGIINQGQRNAAGVNAAMTSDARRQQMAALQGETNTALGQAGVTLGQQQFGLDAWRAQTGAALSAAQLGAMQQQNGFNNNMRMLDFYSGF